jgi:hypothetical protein
MNLCMQAQAVETLLEVAKEDSQGFWQIFCFAECWPHACLYFLIFSLLTQLYLFTGSLHCEADKGINTLFNKQ